MFFLLITNYFQEHFIEFMGLFMDKKESLIVRVMGLFTEEEESVIELRFAYRGGTMSDSKNYWLVYRRRKSDSESYELVYDYRIGTNQDSKSSDTIPK